MADRGARPAGLGWARVVAALLACLGLVVAAMWVPMPAARSDEQPSVSQGSSTETREAEERAQAEAEERAKAEAALEAEARVEAEAEAETKAKSQSRKGTDGDASGARVSEERKPGATMSAEAEDNAVPAEEVGDSGHADADSGATAGKDGFSQPGTHEGGDAESGRAVVAPPAPSPTTSPSCDAQESTYVLPPLAEVPAVAGYLDEDGDAIEPGASITVPAGEERVITLVLTAPAGQQPSDTADPAEMDLKVIEPEAVQSGSSSELGEDKAVAVAKQATWVLAGGAAAPCPEEVPRGLVMAPRLQRLPPSVTIDGCWPLVSSLQMVSTSSDDYTSTMRLTDSRGRLIAEKSETIAAPNGQASYQSIPLSNLPDTGGRFTLTCTATIAGSAPVSSSFVFDVPARGAGQSVTVSTFNPCDPNPQVSVTLVVRSRAADAKWVSVAIDGRNSTTDSWQQLTEFAFSQVARDLALTLRAPPLVPSTGGPYQWRIRAGSGTGSSAVDSQMKVINVGWADPSVCTSLTDQSATATLSCSDRGTAVVNATIRNFGATGSLPCQVTNGSRVASGQVPAGGSSAIVLDTGKATLKASDPVVAQTPYAFASARQVPVPHGAITCRPPGSQDQPGGPQGQAAARPVGMAAQSGGFTGAGPANTLPRMGMAGDVDGLLAATGVLMLGGTLLLVVARAKFRTRKGV